jgi:hypothetical protein
MSTPALQPTSLDRLGHALGHVADYDPTALPTLAQGERIQELLRLRHVLDGVIARSVSAFDAAKGGAAEPTGAPPAPGRARGP